MQQHSVPKFSSGRIFITPNAAQNLSSVDVTTALRRHLHGDWGDLASSNREENERRLFQGRLVSAYRSGKGQRFWVTTEADRSSTTILLPEDW